MTNGTLIQDIWMKDIKPFAVSLLSYEIILVILGKNCTGVWHTVLEHFFKISFFSSYSHNKPKKSWGQAWIYCPT